MRFYKPELDGLRFGAFLAVFICHTGPILFPSTDPWVMAILGVGGYGVSLFYTLSSFLITTRLLEEDAGGDVNIGNFYTRRVLRIWPVYFVALTTATALHPSLFPSLMPFYLFLGNFSMAATGLVALVFPLWSICVEEQFYLLWPLALKAVGGQKGMRSLALFLVVTAMVGRCLLVALHAYENSMWLNTVSHLDTIAFGALLAAGLNGKRIRLPNSVRLGMIVSAILSAIVLGRYTLHGMYAASSFSATVITYPAVAVGALMILVAVMDADTGVFRLFTHPLIRYLGKISYGLYVYHIFALSATGLSSPRQILLGFLTTVAVAMVSYELMEKPLLRVKLAYAA